MSKDKPAILDGKPIFQKKLGIIRPVLDKYADSIAQKVQALLKTNMVSGVNIETVKLEEELKRVLDASEVVSMSGCTAGMILTIQALGLRNSEIIIPSFTFSATAHMLYWNNCKPVFADVNPETFNIDADTVKEVITPKTKAILGVHIYGNPIDVQGLHDIVDKKGIHLLFDGAHALGTKYKGKGIGGIGTATSFSASPTKVLSTIEGGFVSTNMKDLAEKLRVSRNYGNNPDYSCDLPGLNARLSEINATVGLIQMPDVDTFVRNRNQYADEYLRLLKKIPGLSFQQIRHGDLSTYKDFSVIVDPTRFGLTRDELATVLNEEGIQTKYYFFPPVHQLEAYRSITTDKQLPNTVHLSNNVISIPIYNIMEKDEIEGIVSAIRGANNYASEIKQKIKAPK